MTKEEAWKAVEVNNCLGKKVTKTFSQLNDII